MKKLGLLLFLALGLAVATPAAAGTIPIGHVSGTGSVNVVPPNYGSPLAFSFTGAFDFFAPLDPIFGDVGQYQFQANSAGVPIVDGDGVGGAVQSVGTAPWQILNTSAPNQNSQLYGPAFAWTPTFAPDFLSGTINGTLTTDGFIHWYYGYDSTVGPPAGRTALLDFNTSSVLDFTGRFTTTGSTTDQTTGVQTAQFTFEGDISANPVPEPATLTLMGLGMVGVKLARRRRTNKSA